MFEHKTPLLPLKEGNAGSQVWWCCMYGIQCALWVKQLDGIFYWTSSHICELLHSAALFTVKLNESKCFN